MFSIKSKQEKSIAVVVETLYHDSNYMKAVLNRTDHVVDFSAVVVVGVVAAAATIANAVAVALMLIMQL